MTRNKRTEGQVMSSDLDVVSVDVLGCPSGDLGLLDVKLF